MTTSRLRAIATGALLLIPIALILLRVLSWIRLGVDYPYADDWRALLDRELGVFDLAAFFTVSNDTLYPVGKFLDWAAHVTLGSHTVAYQAVSQVAVLGTVLALQFVLLRRALVSPLLAAALATLSILGLRAGESYWGVANLGYQQALPVLCLLGILAIATGAHGGRAVVTVVASMLALVAGFAYISGAFAVLAAGLVLLVAARFTRGDLRTRLGAAGLGAAVGGAISSVAQLVATMSGEGGSSLSMPWDPDVWRFMLGVLADSLLLPAGRPALSFAVILAVVAVAVVVGVVLAVRVIRGRAGRRETTLTVVYLGLAVAIAAYLGLVAVGRLEYLRGTDDGADAFLLGWERFYQWWPTVFWPWLAAAGLLFLRAATRGRTQLRRGVVAGVALGAVAVSLAALATGAYDYDTRHRSLAQQRDAISRCVSQTLASAEPVVCQTGRTWDLAGAVLHADDIGVTFTRDLQLTPSADGEVLGRLTEDGEGAFEPGSSATVTPGGGGFEVSGSARHAWRFTPADEAGLAACSVLEVRLEVAASRADSTLVRYRAIGDGASEPRQKARNLRRVDGVESVSVTVLSADGFAAPVTILPAVGSREYRLDELELICHRTVAE